MQEQFWRKKTALSEPLVQPICSLAFINAATLFVTAPRQQFRYYSTVFSLVKANLQPISFRFQSGFPKAFQAPLHLSSKSNWAQKNGSQRAAGLTYLLAFY